MGLEFCRDGEGIDGSYAGEEDNMSEDRVFINTKVKKVMLLTWNPIMESGKDLNLSMGYNDPSLLVEEYVNLIWETSRHTYKYEIVSEEMISSPTRLYGDFIYRTPDLEKVLFGKM